MGAILLLLLSFVQPEDASVLYGMDMSWAQFSRYWERMYETSLNAARTSQGSHDMERWHQRYQAKFEIPMAGRFSFRYRFKALYDYEASMHEHRLEPTMRIAPNFYLHWVLVPYYFKRENQTGLGFSWRNENFDWLSFYAIVQNFDNNLSKTYVSEGPEKYLYSRIPLRFEADARCDIDRVRLRLHAELGTLSSRFLDWPDSSWYYWEQDKDTSSAWGRVEINPLSGVWTGVRFSASRSRAETRWNEQGIVTADTIRNRWITPFVSCSPTERLELLTECRLWRMNRDMDSVRYRRDFFVLSATANWNPVPWFVFGAGYQRSWRYRYNDEELIADPWFGRHPGRGEHSRLVFTGELRFKSGFTFVIKEGLEADYFPRDLFLLSPHEHTYVGFYAPLSFVPSSKE